METIDSRIKSIRARLERSQLKTVVPYHVPDCVVQTFLTRKMLSRVLNGQTGISPEIALCSEWRLGEERGGEALLWLVKQSAYDVWQAAQCFKTTSMRVQSAP